MWPEVAYQSPEVRIDAGHRLLVAEQQRLVAGEELRLRACSGCVSGVDADGRHEVERLGDPVGQFAGSARPAGCRRRSRASSGGRCRGRRSRRWRRRAAGSASRPTGGRPDQPLRIGHAGLGRELDAVDDVAAIGRQRRRRRCVSMSAPSAAWRTGRRCGPPSPPACRRRRSAPPPSAGTARKMSRMLSARMLGEALGAVAALQQEGLAVGDLGQQRLFSLRASPAKTSGGNPASCASTAFKLIAIRIGRHLLDRLVPPARRCPTLAHDSPLTPARPFAGGHRNLDLLDLGQKRAL